MCESALSAEWEFVPFEECLEKSSRGHRLQSVQQSEYQESGNFPVIDQGANLIAGYTDNENSVYSGPLPVVIFGDHTRIFKYVDFPFAPGADGTKILVPNEKFNCRYFYYALSFLDIPSRGYNRHFKFLKEKYIQRPPLPEQRSIAAVLSKIQEAIAAQQEIIDQTRELKKALMAKLFLEGLRGERTKETEIGPVPESWEVVRLKKIADDYSGGTPSKQVDSYWDGNIPWATPKDMKHSHLKDTIDHISEKGLRNGSRIVPAGSVFIVIRGMILAKNIPICRCLVPMAFNQDMKALVGKEGFDGAFLLYAMQASKDQLERHISSAGHGTKRISTSAIQDMLIPLPTVDERNEIVRLLLLMDEKEDSALARHAAITDLFKTMLHELMTGHIPTTPLMEV